MKSYRQKKASVYRIFVWVILFILSAFLLHLILPGELKFKYEYIKGSPWKHEDLVAPFDFAILKTKDEIEKEKQEVINSMPIYFNVDTNIAAMQIKRLRNDLDRQVDSTVLTKQVFIERVLSVLSKLYETGILLRSPESYEVLKGKKEIAKIAGNVSTKIPVVLLYSEKTAYHTFINSFNQLLEEYPSNRGALNQFNPREYIVANLRYDPEITQKQIDEALLNISPTLGMVQSGKRIILNGEIVDSSKYVILESLKNTYKKESGEGVNKHLITAGKLLLILVFLVLIFIFLFFYRKDILFHLRSLIFLLFLFITIVFISIFANSYEGIHIYLVPLVILPIVIRTFFDSRTAIFMLVITSLLIGFYAPNNYEYVLLQVVAGIIVVFSLAKMHRRVHLVMASVWVLLSYTIVFLAINLIQEGNLLNINYGMLKWFAGSSLLILLVYPLIYVFEKLFGFISDVTLIEVSDTNQPLLRKLAEEAPGTFQHSIQVANLAEEVILKIGGNPFLVRAGALYHDVGKIAKATYFTENQFGIENPHDKMDYAKSAEIIISHVKDGVKVAKRHKLPESLIEFIATHHGTTRAKYFYLKKQEDNPDTKIDGKPFTYPGPLPKSKEAAVVMLVDGIEAASRSMKDKNMNNLKELIGRMIDQKVNEQQLNDSDLTFKDINSIKEILLYKLLNIYHVRIEYPKEVSEKKR